ncbi:MAG: cytochrome c-type biogenesis protein CcmH [Fidelibacterota bacterium]|nr:MAG: cytochrome c-type biogenesis protein CcmH [Candidatus Neomarinimicrobiota bacterium]
MMKRAFLSIALIFLAGHLWGQSDPMGKDALQRELEYEIMAPCCYGGPVADHDSDAAQKVKEQIARLLAEGKTKEEILDMYVAIYGEQILARPRAQGFNLLAYIMPPTILLVGGLLVVYFVSRIKAPASEPSSVESTSYSDEFFKKIEKEMQELNI